MSDFPRGWTLTSATGGATAPSITVPAVPGVVHVLDGFDAIAYNGAAANAGTQIFLSSSDGVFTNYPIGYLLASATSPASDSASGLDLAAGPGASLAIAFQTFFNTANFLRVQGHDI